jgi:hypothetical protein
VKTLPFWITAAGGVLLAITFVTSAPALVAAGATFFGLGLLLFFGAAVRRGRAEGARTATVLGRGLRDALRFAWHLMP